MSEKDAQEQYHPTSLTPFSTIFQIYCSNHINWWRKQDHLEKNTGLSQSTDKHTLLISWVKKLTIYNIQQKTFLEYKTRNEKQYSNYKLLYCNRYGLFVFRSRLTIENSKLRNRCIGKSCCVSVFMTIFPKIKHIPKIDHVDSFYSQKSKIVFIH